MVKYLSLPEVFLILFINEGDFGDGVRYKFCALGDVDTFCTCGLDDVGVEGRNFDVDGIFLDDDGDEDGDDFVDDEAPIFLIVGGVNVDAADLSPVLVFPFIGEGARTGFRSWFKLTLHVVLSLSLQSCEDDPSFRFVGGVKFEDLTPPIFFSSPSCFLRISSISGEVYLSLFLS